MLNETTAPPMLRQIPFNRPSFVGREAEYVAAAVANGRISGDGAFTLRSQQLLAKTVGVPAALLTTSGTHALELAAVLLDLQPGDEVIVPSFTYVSAANAFVLRGARPVFIDSRPDTLNLDERQLEALITPRTRAILVMHYAGVACEMDAISTMASSHGIAILEDNAHGLFGRYRGRNLGSFGMFAAQSFHETKNMSCGEGGALLVNDISYLERAEIVRQKGTDRGRFVRGDVDRYTWVDVGSSYSMSDLLAAVLLAQLEQRERVQTARRTIWERYATELRLWAAENNIALPIVPPECEQPWHLFYIQLPSSEARQRLIEHLQRHAVLAVFHYQPLNASAMGQRFGGRPGQCPVAEDVSQRLLRLPFYFGLGGSQQDQVIEALLDFRV